MRAIVTGAAGFIGSALAEGLVERGASVVGVDSFSDYYDPAQKRSTARHLGTAGVDVVEGDLLELDLVELLADVDVVFHQAGQPGVRASWSGGFESYARDNILVTQALLEAARNASSLQRFVFASSSSVYGNVEVYPCTEATLPRPFSPYGVTKLAAEHLCSLYAHNWSLPTVSLRYFTIYGPRQRPDMAFHRLIQAALDGREFELYGDGGQRREFTFVGDVVEANIAAATSDVAPGTYMNVSGGQSVSMNDVIEQIESELGPMAIRRTAAVAGDVRETGATTDRAAELLDWAPMTSLAEGIKTQIDWHRMERGSRR
ncbi:MAG: NAD-dependent epimerase/dehydratase family protein [Acidimicrobiales bacterium]